MIRTMDSKANPWEGLDKTAQRSSSSGGRCRSSADLSKTANADEWCNMSTNQMMEHLQRQTQANLAQSGALQRLRSSRQRSQPALGTHASENRTAESLAR